MMGGIGSAMAQGAAFGAGSEVAHEAIRGLTGGHGANTGMQATNGAAQQQPNYPCVPHMNDFLACIKANPYSIGSCQHFWGEVQNCEATNSMGKQM